MGNYSLLRIYIPAILILLCFSLPAQNTRKNLQAVRVMQEPKIDGILDEAVWQNAQPAKDFIQFNPYNGRPASMPTEVRIVYDDRAIYVGAMMYDSAPDSIYRELGERDDHDMNADFFTIDFSPFNDGLNAFEFRVAASGTEGDTKYAANYDDRNWDPIWKSAVMINDSGWVAEMEIPYAAIRFPKTDVQEWGLNIWRNIRRYREHSTWNYIDNTKDGIFNQSGTLTGINDIEPPLRLFFIPYVAGYTEKAPESNSWAYSFNYGLDMKLGLSESFTLDMTLVPDFGQVQSDDQVVNLSPFEVYYQERRPFFTEGTELFERGNIFYTRRVGGTPDGYEDVEDEYTTDSTNNIIENPQEIQLINAVKISGRNRNGTAIGVFNAVNSNTWARVIEEDSSEQKILTHPATNYNMLVFDQSLKNNSYVSLYNTNMYQGRDRYIANVTGTEFSLKTKSDMWGLWGQGNLSQKYFPDDAPEFGYSYGLEAGKISGKFRFKYSQLTQNETYDVTDMGFNQRNNRFDHELDFAWLILEPRGKIIEMETEVDLEYNMLYVPRTFTSFNIGANNRTTFTNYLTAGLNLQLSPVESYDYYEPRVDGWYFTNPPAGWIGGFFSPDYRKKFIVDAGGGYWAGTDYGQSGYNFNIRPIFRVSDRFNIRLNFAYDIDWNNIGYVDSLDANGDEKIIFGARDLQTIETVLDLKYIFTKNISLSLRARHYWVTVDYDRFYDLQEDGSLVRNDYNEDKDFLVNAFNVDMVFRWIFAPASELLFVWKNNIYNERNEAAKDYIDNLRYTFTSPMGNSFSLKVLYYLDYQKLRRKNRKKNIESMEGFRLMDDYPGSSIHYPGSSNQYPGSSNFHPGSYPGQMRY